VHMIVVQSCMLVKYVREIPGTGPHPTHLLLHPGGLQVVLSLSRLDVRYAVLKPLFAPEQVRVPQSASGTESVASG